MNWEKVCSLSDMRHETGVCALINNTQVAIFHVDDKVYAISNHDPFSGANVLSRGIVGDTGEKVYIASPIYKQRFALETGECLDDEKIVIPTYAARINEETIEVSL